MGIKVLLADDSATIKKVMQLSLGDFAAELKAVPSGEDVLSVIRKFQPDLVFIDVLLPQKSGYDLASSIKKDQELSKTPVILLWSAFMDFDEGKFKSSGADAKLEKPFEASSLRQLIHQYVPKTKDSPIAKFLEFPAYEFDSSTGGVVKATTTQATSAQATSAPANDEARWDMGAFDDISKFTEAEEPTNFEAAPQESPPNEGTNTSIRKSLEAAQTTDSEWVRKDLGKFSVPIPQDSGTEEGTVAFANIEADISDTSFLLDPKATPAAGAGHGAPAAVATPPASSTRIDVVSTSAKEEPLLQNAQIPNVSSETLQTMLSSEIEKLVKEQARQIVEKIVWKVVPDMATNLIKEEITRLLKENNP